MSPDPEIGTASFSATTVVASSLNSPVPNWLMVLTTNFPSSKDIVRCFFDTSEFVTNTSHGFSRPSMIVFI